MHILVHTSFYRPELIGIAKYTTELCEWLVGRGHDVSVVAPPPYYPQWCVHHPYRSFCYQSEMLADVDVTRCPIFVPAQPRGVKRVLSGLSFAMASVPVMVRRAMAFPDVVIVVEPSFLNIIPSLLAARVAGAKSWLHIQDFEIDLAFDLGHLRRGRRLIAVIERWLMKQFDVVSTISPELKEGVRNRGVLDPLLLPNWFDPVVPDPDSCSLRSELNISQSTPVVLFSGVLGQKQGVEVLVEAARLLVGHEILFVICGEGPAEHRIRRLAIGLPNVRLIPLQPAPRLNELLTLADIHVLPQHPSAKGSVLPSKLAGMLGSGRPVIACSRESSEIARLVSGCGHIVSPDDPVALATAVVDLMRDPQERSRLGQAGRARALTCFGRDTILTAWQDTLLKLCTSRVAGEATELRSP